MHATPARADTGAPDSPRGARVRERMVLCALDLFGQHGFDGTRTRMIAQAAGVNLAAIPYYFGTKDDLYLAAARHLARHIQQEQAPALARLVQGAGRSLAPEALAEVVITFLQDQVRLLLAEHVPASWVQFFLKAQAEHGDAFEQVFAQVVEPAQQALSEVVGRLLGRAPDAFDTRAITFMLVHQFVCLRVADAALLRRLGWTALTPPRVEQLIATLTPMMRAQLLGVRPSLSSSIAARS